MEKKVGIGIVGSQFISSIHVEALKSVTEAHVVAVMSPTKGNAKQFAKKHGIPNYFTNIDEMSNLKGIDMIIIGAPNNVHCELTLKAARSGKHVVVEKPMCMNLAEADLMIKTCKDANVKLMYAEELCFTPKYVRLKALLDEGALGKPILLKQLLHQYMLKCLPVFILIKPKATIMRSLF